MDHTFVLCNEPWHNRRLQRLYHIFNCRSFRYLHVALSTIVYYELNFLYSSSLFSFMDIHVLHHLLKSLFSLYWLFFASLWKKNVKIGFCISLFLGPLLYCISMCLPHLDSQVLKTSGCPPTFFLCLSFLGILAEFYLCMNFRNSLSKSYY